MKKLLFILCLFPTTIFAQDSLKAKLVGTWIKEEIRLGDDSPVYDPNIQNIRTKYTFFDNNTVRVTYNGKTWVVPYSIQTDTLIINTNAKFSVKELGENRLILQQAGNNNAPLNLLYQIRFISEKVHLLGFRPAFYITSASDTVYISKPNYLEPFFIDAEMRASDYIVQQFNFPEYRKAGFVVRFVITKDNQMKGVRILESTHPKFNDKLIKAVMKTEKKWQAATLENKPVNTEVEMTFDLGWNEKNTMADTTTTPQDKSALSEGYSNDGMLFLEEKMYSKAIVLFDEAIKAYPLNINAYYGRAAAYILSKKPQEGCKDYKTLKGLGQERAATLYHKYCENY